MTSFVKKPCFTCMRFAVKILQGLFYAQQSCANCEKKSGANILFEKSNLLLKSSILTSKAALAVCAARLRIGQWLVKILQGF